MTSGFYGTESHTFFVDNAGIIWVIQAEDGFVFYAVEDLPANVVCCNEDSIWLWLDEPGNESIRDFVDNHI